MIQQIPSVEALRLLKPEELPTVCQQIRRLIVDLVAAKAGHLASGLGVVELTVALHYLFHTPEDKLVWDVGHQAYPHKILTRSLSQIYSMRQMGGISGFPSIKESPFDAFGTGHSSTSIAAVMGMAQQALLAGNTHRHHIAVIGDASITSGIALEALNLLNTFGGNILVIINDNQMSIDQPVGELSTYFKELPRLQTETFFKSLNLPFLGSVNGHNLSELLKALQKAQSLQGIKVLHVQTIKGKGLEQAEANSTLYHAPTGLNKYTGEISAKFPELIKYQTIVGKTLIALADSNPKVVALTPAMLSGSSLLDMKQKYPHRTFDVGIAEDFLITFAAGMAASGLLPYCVVYSTFLQRAFDQIIHDVALQNLPVVLCIDRAGLVGHDGATHHGAFDISYLNLIPNLVIVAPNSETELSNVLYSAQFWKKPVAVRYPRGSGKLLHFEINFKEVPFGKGELIKKGSEVALLSIGVVPQHIQNQIECQNLTHYHLRFVKPLDEPLLHKIFTTHSHIITFEEGSYIGGFGQSIVSFAQQHNYKNNIKTIALPDVFIPHASINELQQTYIPFK